MKRRAHAKRRDLNEPDIVQALRDDGLTVILLDEPLDLLVGGRGATILLEVKNGELAPADRRLTDLEAEFLRTWKGGPAGVARCVEEARCVAGVHVHAAGCGCGGVADPAWMVAARKARR